MKNLLILATILCFIGCKNVDTTTTEQVAKLTQDLQKANAKLKAASIDETAFIHTVFFWFNEGISEEQKSDFAKNGLTNLVKVPSIYKGYFGPPAMTPRDVVDNSYDFALVCHFKNKADQDLYQDDPGHLKFIEDYKHLWKSVQVYDNLLSE